MIKNWFAAPKFEDHQQNHVASLLNGILLVALAMVILAMVIFLLGWISLSYSDAFIQVGANVFTLLIILTSYRLMHQRRIQTASYLYLLSMWLMLTGVVIAVGGVRLSVALWLFGLIIPAGMLLSTRGIFLFSGLNMFSFTVAFWVESHGFQFVTYEEQAVRPVEFWFTYLFLTMIVAALLFFTMRSISLLLERLIKEEQDLTAKNRELQAIQANLEERVVARTQGLETVARLSEQLSAILNVNELAAAVVNQIQANFGYYHAHIYLLDEAGKLLVVAEGTGDAGTAMKASRHSIPLDAATSLVARAARSGEVVRVDNVREAPDWLPNELLPDTYAEMAVPIISEGRVVGVLDVQENRVGGLDEGDAGLLRLLANQVGVAIKNAELYEALAQLNEDKDTFFSIVAHDLKGPFQPLVGNAELLMEMADFFSPAEIKEMVSSMHRSSKQVLELLENLLQWSRIQMGRLEYQPEHVSLRRLAQETVDLLAVNAAAKEISLVNEIQPQTIAYADSNMLNTVVRNLVNNALKFTPQGGHIAVSATVQEATSMIEVSVADTGIGISADDVAKLFRADVHHSTTGTAKEKGTGLGLILCQEMVEANQGKIRAESEFGQGTTIRFTVPLGQLEEAGVELVDDTDETALVASAEKVQSISAVDQHRTKLLKPVEVMKMSESVNRSAKAVYDLLDDLHNWVLKELEWIPYTPQEIGVKESVEQTITALADRAQRNKIHLQSEVGPEVKVYGDENILSVVLQGLILNAMRFTPENGTVIINSDNKLTNQVVISISDMGQGSSRKVGSDLLNQPFSSADKQSVGLGLLMYKELVERNQGEIWMESEAGQGTTVRFTLPVSEGNSTSIENGNTPLSLRPQT